MEIIPKCSGCGKAIALFKATPLCDSCEEKEKLAEKSAQIELERQRLAKVAALNSILKNPLALLLAPHIDSTVCVNYNKPDSCDHAVLIAVTDVHFTIEAKGHQQIHIPLSQILQIVEEPRCLLFIAVMQLVIYKRAFGISVPINP